MSIQDLCPPLKLVGLAVSRADGGDADSEECGNEHTKRDVVRCGVVLTSIFFSPAVIFIADERGDLFQLGSQEVLRVFPTNFDEMSGFFWIFERISPKSTFSWREST